MLGISRQIPWGKAHSGYAAKKLLLLGGEEVVGLLGHGGCSFPNMLGGMRVGDTAWGELSTLGTVRTAHKGGMVVTWVGGGSEERS